MSESLHEISTPVPFLTLCRLGPVNTLFKVQGTPDVNEGTKIERKANPTWRITLLQVAEIEDRRTAFESSRVIFVYSV